MLSAGGGGSTTRSAKSRKRRREFLDLDSDGSCENELVRFVLDTQGKLRTGCSPARELRGADDNDDETFK